MALQLLLWLNIRAEIVQDELELAASDLGRIKHLEEGTSHIELLIYFFVHDALNFIFVLIGKVIL